MMKNKSKNLEKIENIKNIENIENIKNELEQYTKATDKNSIEYKIFANPEYREVILTRLQETKSLLTKLQSKMKIELNNQPKNNSFPYLELIFGTIILVQIFLIIALVRKKKGRK